MGFPNTREIVHPIAIQHGKSSWLHWDIHSVAAREGRSLERSGPGQRKLCAKIALAVAAVFAEENVSASASPLSASSALEENEAPPTLSASAIEEKLSAPALLAVEGCGDSRPHPGQSDSPYVLQAADSSQSFQSSSWRGPVKLSNSNHLLTWNLKNFILDWFLDDNATATDLINGWLLGSTSDIITITDSYYSDSCLIIHAPLQRHRLYCRGYGSEALRLFLWNGATATVTR